LAKQSAPCQQTSRPPNVRWGSKPAVLIAASHFRSSLDKRIPFTAGTVLRIWARAADSSGGATITSPARPACNVNLRHGRRQITLLTSSLLAARPALTSYLLPFSCALTAPLTHSPHTAFVVPAPQQLARDSTAFPWPLETEFLKLLAQLIHLFRVA
jgi:hypothetical protein